MVATGTEEDRSERVADVLSRAVSLSDELRATVADLAKMLREECVVSNASGTESRKQRTKR